MATPILVSLESNHPGAVALIAAGCAADVDAPRWFLVVREGAFNGRSYAAGEVVLCGGPARHGHEVVLVARGHGRPRLGTVRGSELYGDVGERCHRARWLAAGRLVAAASPHRGGWRTRALTSTPVQRDTGWLEAAREVVDVERTHPSVFAAGLRRSSARAQLSLFAEAA